MAAFLGNNGDDWWYSGGGSAQPGFDGYSPWWDASWGAPPWISNGGWWNGGGGDPNGPVIGSATGYAGGAPPISTTVNTQPSVSQTAGGRLSTPGVPTGPAPFPNGGVSGSNSTQLHPAIHQLFSLLMPPKLKPPPLGANALPGQLLNQANLNSQMNSTDPIQLLLQHLLQGRY